MQDMYNFVIVQDISTLLCLLFIVIYGIPFGINNWFVKVVCLLSNLKPTGQLNAYKWFDSAWLICVFWVTLVFLK